MKDVFFYDVHFFLRTYFFFNIHLLPAATWEELCPHYFSDENIQISLNQSNAKLTLIVTWSLAFSRATRSFVFVYIEVSNDTDLKSSGTLSCLVSFSPRLLLLSKQKAIYLRAPSTNSKLRFFTLLHPGITQKIRFLFFVLDDHLKSGKNHNFSIQNIFIRKFKFFFVIK